MRAWWTLVLVALSLSGCLGGDADGNQDLDGLDAGAADAPLVAFRQGSEELVAGPWERVVAVTVGPGWRDLGADLAVGLPGDPYAGTYDIELVGPDGSTYGACGPGGCGPVLGGSVHLGPGDADGLQQGEWTLRVWGSGLGTVRYGLEAQVPEGSLVPVESTTSRPVAANWRETLGVDLPAGSRSLRAEVDFTAYDGLWTGRFLAPDGTAHGACKDGCGPTVVNNAGDRHAVEAPAPGTWSVEAEGAGAGLLTLRLSALVPAGAEA